MPRTEVHSGTEAEIGPAQSDDVSLFIKIK